MLCNGTTIAIAGRRAQESPDRCSHGGPAMSPPRRPLRGEWNFDRFAGLRHLSPLIAGPEMRDRGPQDNGSVLASIRQGQQQPLAAQMGVRRRMYGAANIHDGRPLDGAAVLRDDLLGLRVRQCFVQISANEVTMVEYVHFLAGQAITEPPAFGDIIAHPNERQDRPDCNRIDIPPVRNQCPFTNPEPMVVERLQPGIDVIG